MNDVRLVLADGGPAEPCEFRQSAPFIIAPFSNQIPLAEAFTVQANRFGWPVTFPMVEHNGDTVIYPVIEFTQHPKSGEIRYHVVDWQPSGEPETTVPAPVLKSGKP